MATTRKAAVDPLVEELPQVQESKPNTANDVKFDVEISAYVAGGSNFFRWKIVDQNAKEYVGDYTEHVSVPDAGLRSAEQAEANAKEYIERVRQAIDLKLSAPEAYRITL